MMTSAQCLAKAEELTVLAALSGDPETRNSLHELAREWRNIAVMARAQDAAPNPGD
jgi:hypothetical protein